MDAILEDLVADVIDALPKVVHEPMPAVEPKDRSGWFHASDLKGGSIKFKPQECVDQYLGLGEETVFSAETCLSLGIGIGIDRLFDAALSRCWGITATQADLRDEALRLRGTPDFIFAPWAEPLPGDVKSCGPMTYRRYWANDGWSPSGAYFHRQLQAYMMLTGADRSVLMVVNRAGCEMGDDISRCVTARWVYEDLSCQAGIKRDLEYLLRCVKQRSPLPA